MNIKLLFQFIVSRFAADSNWKLVILHYSRIVAVMYYYSD